MKYTYTIMKQNNKSKIIKRENFSMQIYMIIK